MFKKRVFEFTDDEIIVALCYNLGMIKENNILISNLNLSDLKELAETYFKLSKSENKDIKKKSEKLLIETLDFMDKAHKGEVMTVNQYSKNILDAIGGKDKAIALIKDIKKSKMKYTQSKKGD